MLQIIFSTFPFDHFGINFGLLITEFISDPIII